MKILKLIYATKKLETDLLKITCLHDIEMVVKEKLVDKFRTERARNVYLQIKLIIIFDLPIVKGIPNGETYIHRVSHPENFEGLSLW
ncbi:hypothetical protein CWI39_2897p0010 [Hamiltosporidium magnivora]|uniref:Uncharacterized protein n=1 Tax=Hamiltosporidium magnivora TaxID=148818 RepID=A0A4Q9KS23_9MICR|nr:hypothetical protein CWI39_2897p0010 [Hamiltosporidium magnivora]